MLVVKFKLCRQDDFSLNALSGNTAINDEAAILDKALINGGESVQLLRSALDTADSILRDRFLIGTPIEDLVHRRALIVDQLLINIFKRIIPDSNLALIAVGGYGRGELHPHSDIDLLILSNTEHNSFLNDSIGLFIAFLWDIGLRANHSVRSLEDCVSHAKLDIGIATNLLESRFLAGDKCLFNDLNFHTKSHDFWPAKQFFTAKIREQQERHAKFYGVQYRLEPNVKDGPGGLRDIQMIAWIAKRHFDTANLKSLLSHGFLTNNEYTTLKEGQHFLWRIRFALHLIHGRCEDRLLFDSQVRIADQFGYHDKPGVLGVEQLMQDYYRTIKELSLLNDMILQLIEESIFETAKLKPYPINDIFEERGGFLRTRDLDIFSKRPSTILELFLILARHPNLKGVSAETIRHLRSNLEYINSAFRNHPDNRSQFLQLLREPRGVTHELRRMNRYGVLSRYLPAFGKIVGRMQYDLFHVYTVDEHILFVVSNLRRFMLSKYNHEFPLCSSIMQSLPKPEIALIAAMFHDIAKGRNADHSIIGADEVTVFCLQHGMSRYDAQLAAWLVRFHLLLSLTAQKRDINDPHVVNEFARQVGDQNHLDYLYVLTVADIHGTNPELWNAWKASLCYELYQNTSRILLHGLENSVNKDNLIWSIKEESLAILQNYGLQPAIAQSLWSAFYDDYFMHHTPGEIAWHASCLAGRLDSRVPLVFIHKHAPRGGTAICIYSKHDQYIFCRVTATLAELGLTVLDARLMPMKNGEHLDTYMILEENGETLTDSDRLIEIENHLNREINRHNSLPITVTRQAPRQVRMFTTPTRINFTNDLINQQTILEVSAADRPGLLSIIGQVFGQYRIRLRNAKITTIGERAEDVFFITDPQDNPIIDPVLQDLLHASLLTMLGESM